MEEDLKTLLLKLKYALNNILFLNQCELEGMRSGMPTTKQWEEGFNMIQQALDSIHEYERKNN